MQIRDRTFGAPVSDTVINIFKKLQEGVADVNPLDPVSEKIDTTVYLGDRTPFARLWTAVSIIGVSKTKFKHGVEKEYRDSFFYVINDNNQNAYEPNKQVGKRITQLSSKSSNQNKYFKPPAGITSVSSKTKGTLGVIKSTIVNFVVHNKDDFDNIVLPYFLRPGTTVCCDFGWSVKGENTELYSIEKFVKSTVGEINETKEGTDVAMENFYKDIYGVGQITEVNGKPSKSDDYKPGFLRKSRNYGRVNTFMGQVLNYNTTVTPNGSFECSVEFLSGNASLLDREITEENHLKFAFSNILEDTLIAGLSGVGVDDFVRDVKTLSTLSGEKRQELSSDYFDKVFESTEGIIPDYAKKLGIFHQDVTSAGKAVSGTTQEVLYINYGLFEDIFLNNMIVRKKNTDEYDKYETTFLSHDCYVRWDTYLYDRQTKKLEKNESLPAFMYPGGEPDYWSNTYNSSRRPGVGPPVVVPTFGEYTVVSGDYVTAIAKKYGITKEEIRDANELNENYDIGVGQKLKIPKNETQASDVSNKAVAEDIKLNRIPIRELFISVPLIKNAFATKQNVNDALEHIFEEINADSYNVFSIKMVSNNQANTSVGFQDENLLPAELFTDEFKGVMFDVTSKNSIVTNLDLKFEMPKSGLGNMIAIKGFETDKSYFDVNQLDRFRMLDLIDPKMGFPLKDVDKDGMKEEAVIVKSLPEAINQDSTEPGDTFNAPFDYQKVLASLSGVKTKAIEGMDVLDPFTDPDAGLISPDKGSIYKQYVEGVVNILNNLEDEGEKKPTKTIELSSDAAARDNKKIIFANSLRDEQGKLAYINTFLGSNDNSVAPILPLSLTLTVYGNSYLTIGDIIKVNYLPEVYRDNCFFQIVGVEDKLSTTIWETTYETVFKPIPTKKKKAGDITEYEVRYSEEFKRYQVGKQSGPKNNAHGDIIDNHESVKYNGPFEVTKIITGTKKDVGEFKETAVRSNYNANIISNGFVPPTTFEQVAFLYAFSQVIFEFSYVYSDSGNVTFVPARNIDDIGEKQTDRDGKLALQNPTELRFIYDDAESGKKKYLTKYIIDNFEDPEERRKVEGFIKSKALLNQDLKISAVKQALEIFKGGREPETLMGKMVMAFLDSRGSNVTMNIADPRVAPVVIQSHHALKKSSVAATSIGPAHGNNREVQELYNYYLCEPKGIFANMNVEALSISEEILNLKHGLGISAFLNRLKAKYKEYYKMLVERPIPRPPGKILQDEVKEMEKYNLEPY